MMLRRRVATVGAVISCAWAKLEGWITALNVDAEVWSHTGRFLQTPPPTPSSVQERFSLYIAVGRVHLADVYMSTAGHPVQSSQIPPALTWTLIFHDCLLSTVTTQPTRLHDSILFPSSIVFVLVIYSFVPFSLHFVLTLFHSLFSPRIFQFVSPSSVFVSLPSLILLSSCAFTHILKKKPSFIYNFSFFPSFLFYVKICLTGFM